MEPRAREKYSDIWISGMLTTVVALIDWCIDNPNNESTSKTVTQYAHASSAVL